MKIKIGTNAAAEANAHKCPKTKNIVNYPSCVCSLCMGTGAIDLFLKKVVKQP